MAEQWVRKKFMAGNLASPAWPKHTFTTCQNDAVPCRTSAVDLPGKIVNSQGVLIRMPAKLCSRTSRPAHVALSSQLPVSSTRSKPLNRYKATDASQLNTKTAMIR